MTPPSKTKAYSRRYDKLRRVYGYRATVDGTITRRKLAALQAIGYSLTEIGSMLTEVGEEGRTQQSLSDTFHGGRLVHVSTAAAIDALYERLHLTPNDTPYASRTRARAARLRYPAPLAWDDIDNLNEKPQGVIRK